MKTKAAGDKMTDDEVMIVSAEVSSSGIQKKIRREMFSYANYEEDHPGVESSKLLEKWKEMVDKAASKTEVDGVLYISKAPKLIVDRVESNMATTTVSRTARPENTMEFGQALTRAEEEQRQFSRASAQASGLHSSVPDICEEARLVNRVDHNVSDNIDAAMAKALLSKRINEDMTRQAVKEQESVEQALHDWQVEKTVKDAKKANYEKLKAMGSFASIEFFVQHAPWVEFSGVTGDVMVSRGQAKSGYPNCLKQFLCV